MSYYGESINQQVFCLVVCKENLRLEKIKKNINYLVTENIRFE